MSSRLILLFLGVYCILLISFSSYAQCEPGRQPSGVELVSNGDFSQGNTGFSSSYHYIPNGPITYGDYSVNVNPPSFYSGFSQIYGHTTGTPTDSFMIVDGAGILGISIWCQTINVTPNTIYNFSSWICNLNDQQSPSILQFTINGDTIGNKFNTNINAGIWEQFFANWNSGNNTTATICLTNNNVDPDGNDFGMDDISFQPCVCSVIIPDAGQDKTICKNDNVQLTASGAADYAWTPATGLSATNINNPIATPATTTTYTVVISTGTCSEIDSVKISVNPLPTVTTSETPVTCFNACNGSSLANAQAGAGNYTYTWTGSSQTTQTASNLCAGAYTITINDANNCTATTTFTITEPSPLSLTTQKTDASCGNSDGTATAQVSGGTSGYTYSWSSSGGNNQTTMIATGLAPAAYTLTIYDAKNCSITSTVNIINQGTLNATTQFTPPLCNGIANGTASATPSGGGSSYSYSWNTTPSQSTQTASNLSAGTYSVTISDNNNCSTTISVIVTEPSLLSTSIQKTDANCGSNDGSATANITGGTSGYTYTWSSSAQTSNSITGIAAGIYTLTVNDVNTCSVTSTFTIGSVGSLSAPASFNPPSCFGSSNGTASATPTAGTTPFTYSWSTTPTQTNQQATGLIAGIYSVTITDINGCIANSTVSITEPAIVTASCTGKTICFNQQTTITSIANGGTSPYTYSWSNNSTTQNITVNPAIPTSYSLIVTDANGCTSAPDSAIIQFPSPIILDIASNNNACIGSALTLTASASGGNGNYSYTWLPGNSSTSNTNVIINSAITYTLTVSDGCSKNVIDSVSISALPLPTVNFKGDTSQKCTSDCTQFNDLSSFSGGIVAWNWDFGDNKTSTSQNPKHCYSNSGVYDVYLEIEASNGCKADTTFLSYISLNLQPDAAFTMSASQIKLYEPAIQFTNTSTNALTYTWDFDDNTAQSTELNPSHLFSDTGTYCIDLIAISSNNCVDTTTQCLHVVPNTTIFVPNAFTPGTDDSKNANFGAVSTNISKFEMWIFDRWGNQVFYTNDINQTWNGVVQNGSSNELAQQDVYVYYINALDIYKESHELVGHVTLLR